MELKQTEIERFITNIRVLCAESVEKAKSGHVGSAMGLTPFLFNLFTKRLNYNPDNPKDTRRDIFFMSNAHCCIIHYVMNYLIGYLDLEDLKNFRQYKSKTPGHPEKNDYGIEITSEPLGQGVCEALGMAIAFKKLGRKGTVFCVFGDGCYQEGMSQEAFSLAVHLNLNNLIYIYDYNKMTIDGSTELSMTEIPRKRFEALNFDVIELNGDIYDNNWYKSLEQGDRPKVVILNTTIGKGCIFEGQNRTHGLPLGDDIIKKMRKDANLPEESFSILPELLTYFRNLNKLDGCGISEKKFEPKNVEFIIKKYESKPTRTHFKDALNEIYVDNILSGSADLTPSIGTRANWMKIFDRNNRSGNYIHYGVREHAAVASMNGLSGFGFKTVFGTFLNFVTYCYPAIRLACLDNNPSVFVFSHDSIFVAEDGPTHQPIEALPLLRSSVNMTVIRPSCGSETRFAVKYAMMAKSPVSIILSRQIVEEYEGDNYEEAHRGAYIVKSFKNPAATIIATGSEVSLAVNASKKLEEKNVFVNVVSMLSQEIFDMQNEGYRKATLHNNFNISLEAASTFGWSKYARKSIGIDTFGISANLNDVRKHFKFTVDDVLEKIIEFLK